MTPDNPFDAPAPQFNAQEHVRNTVLMWRQTTDLIAMALKRAYDYTWKVSGEFVSVDADGNPLLDANGNPTEVFKTNGSEMTPEEAQEFIQLLVQTNAVGLMRARQIFGAMITTSNQVVPGTFPAPYELPAWDFTVDQSGVVSGVTLKDAWKG